MAGSICNVLAKTDIELFDAARDLKKTLAEVFPSQIESGYILIEDQDCIYIQVGGVIWHSLKTSYLYQAKF